MNLRRAARYMGCSQLDEKVMPLLRSAAVIVKENAQPRHRMIRLPQTAFPLPGADVKRHLAGCSEIILMAATLGAQMDACIRRESLMDMAMGLAVNACAAAMLEDYLDTLPLPLKAGEYATPRFSPGYGDLPLQTQTRFLSVLNAHAIGLHETAAHMLAPEKSVTALCGVTLTPQQQCIRQCAACSNAACPFREA